MKKLAWLGVASVALLGFVILWSARLVEDVAPPPPEASVPAVALAPADDVPRARLAPQPLALPPTAPAVPVAAPSPAPDAPPAVEPPPEPRKPEPSAPQTLEADTPFGEDSRELEYAFQLATAPESTEPQLRNAAEVFERCLREQPEDARCYRGLVTAQTRLGPGSGILSPKRRGDGFVPRPTFRERTPNKPSPIK